MSVKQKQLWVRYLPVFILAMRANALHGNNKRVWIFSMRVKLKEAIGSNIFWNEDDIAEWENEKWKLCLALT